MTEGNQNLLSDYGGGPEEFEHSHQKEQPAGPSTSRTWRSGLFLLIFGTLLGASLTSGESHETVYNVRSNLKHPGKIFVNAIRVAGHVYTSFKNEAHFDQHIKGLENAQTFQEIRAVLDGIPEHDAKHLNEAYEVLNIRPLSTPETVEASKLVYLSVFKKALELELRWTFNVSGQVSGPYAPTNQNDLDAEQPIEDPFLDSEYYAPEHGGAAAPPDP